MQMVDSFAKLVEEQVVGWNDWSDSLYETINPLIHQHVTVFMSPSMTLKYLNHLSFLGSYSERFGSVAIKVNQDSGAVGNSTQHVDDPNSLLPWFPRKHSSHNRTD